MGVNLHGARIVPVARSAMQLLADRGGRLGGAYFGAQAKWSNPCTAANKSWSRAGSPCYVDACRLTNGGSSRRRRTSRWRQTQWQQSVAGRPGNSWRAESQEAGRGTVAGYPSIRQSLPHDCKASLTVEASATIATTPPPYHLGRPFTLPGFPAGGSPRPLRQQSWHRLPAWPPQS